MLLFDGMLAEPQQFPCSGCGEVLRTRTALQQHQSGSCPAADESYMMVNKTYASDNERFPSSTELMMSEGSDR